MGQVTFSMDFGGSVSSFHADPKDDRATGSIISKSPIYNYSLELRGGYLMENNIEFGLGMAFNHYSKAYNDAFQNFESDNVVWIGYVSYQWRLDHLIVSPGFSGGYGNYKSSINPYKDDGSLIRYSPEIMIGYLLDNERIQPYLSIRYLFKRIERTDLSTGYIAEQIYNQNYLLVCIGIKYSLK